MFNWFNSNDNNEIQEMQFRLEILEAVDKAYIGDRDGTETEVYVIVSKDKSVKIKAHNWKYIEMQEKSAVSLRDFLVKNFPVEPKATIDTKEETKNG